MNEATSMNRVRWDALAQRHGQGDDAYYDVGSFLAGGSSLNERERREVAAAVGPVAGLDLLHLQCHFGLDTLSWAREGAHVTGVDFSPTAVRRARELAAAAGLPASFAEADVLDLPEQLSGRFDVVFASYGVLCWISSAAPWMRSAAACLRPGGAVVLIDIHPLVMMVSTVDPLVLDFPYGGEQPVRFSSSASYAVGGLGPEASQTTQWPHGLGEIVTAAAAAGLRVESLTEWFDEPRTPSWSQGQTDARGSR